MGTWEEGTGSFLGKGRCILTCSALGFLDQTLPQEESADRVSMDQDPKDEPDNVSPVLLEANPTTSLVQPPLPLPHP